MSVMCAALILRWRLSSVDDAIASNPEQKKLKADVLDKARKKLNIDSKKPNPLFD